MKSINIILIALLFSAFSLQAATLVVNNETPNPGQYTTIQAAIAAATAGDVILVKGTATVYTGGCFVNKSLTFVGNGYNPKTASTYATVMNDYFYINNGIHNVNIRGFSFTGVYSYGDNDHVKVEFCKVNGGYVNPTTDCNDWLISNCIFNNGYFSGNSATNVVIEHNILDRGINLTNTSNLLIRNNIFINSNQDAVLGTLTGAIIINNIFYDGLLTGSSGYVGTCTLTSCVISNNVMYRSAGAFVLPTNTGGNSGNTIASNIVDVNPNFINYTTVSGAAAIPFDFTHDFRLNTGSPALTAGVGGTQIGIYAASFPFSMTGEPRIPAVRGLTITTPATNSGVGSSINVNIQASKARAN